MLSFKRYRNWSSRAPARPLTPGFWEWTDGTFIPRLDFRRFSRDTEFFKAPLKATLISYMRGHSSKHVENLFHAFFHFLDSAPSYPRGSRTGI